MSRSAQAVFRELAELAQETDCTVCGELESGVRITPDGLDRACPSCLEILEVMQHGFGDDGLRLLEALGGPASTRNRPQKPSNTDGA